MTGAFAAVAVAALVSPLAGAQENTVAVEGLVWFDRYVRPDADFVVRAPELEPAKDAHRIGDEVTLPVPVTNRGEAADKPSFVMFGSTPEFVSASDNLDVRTAGQEFDLRELVAVGATVELRLTCRLDNHAVVPLEYLPEESTTASPTATAPADPTATSTTTTAAVVQAAGGSSGLASTGREPVRLAGGRLAAARWRRVDLLGGTQASSRLSRSGDRHR